MRSYRLLSLVFVFVLFACTARVDKNDFPQVQRTEPLSLPQYPNSQNEQFSTQANPPGFDDQTLKFQTSDTPEQIIAFYQNYLEQNAWESIRLTTITNEGNPYKGFDYLSAVERQACPTYSFNLLFKRPSTGLIDVLTYYGIESK